MALTGGLIWPSLQPLSEALRTYQDLRRHLGEELGIEPSEELRTLEGAVLRQDARLARPSTKAEPMVAGHPSTPEPPKSAQVAPADPHSAARTYRFTRAHTLTLSQQCKHSCWPTLHAGMPSVVRGRDVQWAQEFKSESFPELGRKSRLSKCAKSQSDRRTGKLVSAGRTIYQRSRITVN